MAQLRERCQTLELQLMEDRSKPPPPRTPPSPSKAEAHKETEEALKKEKEEVRKLQLEMVRLTTELTTTQNAQSVTERRLEGALRGRLRYKELWTRALHEVARLKQDAEANTRNALQRREAEVEGLRREQRFLLNAGDAGASTTPAEGTTAASLTQIRTELQRWVE